jgi:hypothetical protein
MRNGKLKNINQMGAKENRVLTEYEMAWNIFITSDGYRDCHYALADKGIRMPYIENILRVAFDAGYNSRSLNSEQTAQVSDTMKDDSSNAVGNKETFISESSNYFIHPKDRNRL